MRETRSAVANIYDEGRWSGVIFAIEQKVTARTGRHINLAMCIRGWFSSDGVITALTDWGIVRHMAQQVIPLYAQYGARTGRHIDSAMCIRARFSSDGVIYALTDWGMVPHTIEQVILLHAQYGPWIVYHLRRMLNYEQS